MPILVTPEDARDAGFLFREENHGKIYTWGGSYQEGVIFVGPEGSAITRSASCSPGCEAMHLSVTMNNGERYWANFAKDAIVAIATGEIGESVHPGEAVCMHV